MSNVDRIISSLDRNVPISEERNSIKIDGSKFGRTMVNPSFKSTPTVSVNPMAGNSATASTFSQMSQIGNNSATTPNTVSSGTVQYQATSQPTTGTSSGVTMGDLASLSQTNNS